MTTYIGSIGEKDCHTGTSATARGAADFQGLGGSQAHTLEAVRVTGLRGELKVYRGVVPPEPHSQEDKHSTLPRALGIFWAGQCRCMCQL